MPDKKTPSVAVDPMKILAIVSAIIAAASQIVPKLIGKTGEDLRDAIVLALPEVLPIVEQVAGKDFLNDAKFREACVAIVEAFVDAPALDPLKAAQRTLSEG